MKKLTALFFSIVLLLFNVGCNSTVVDSDKSTAQNPGGDSSITFALPSQWANKAAMQELVEKYKQETGTTVEIQALDDKSYTNLYLAKLATGDFYDVIYGKTGPAATVLNLEKNFVDLSEEAWVKEIDQPILDSFLYTNEKVYGAPLGGTNVIGIVYNKTVFKELGIKVPETEEEFVAVCQKIKENEIVPIYVAGKDIWPLVQFPNAEWPAVEAENPGIVEKFNNNTIGFSDVPQCLDFASKMQQYNKMGFYNTDLLTATYDMLLQNFAEGKAAMVFIGDWIAGDLTTKFPGTDFGMFARPTDSGDVYISSTAPDVLYVFKDSPNKDVALDFIRFWQKAENREIWFNENANMPVYKEQVVSNMNACAEDAMQYFETGNVKGHWHNRMVVTNTDDFFRNYQLLLSNDLTPEDFLKKMDENFVMVAKDLKIDGF